MVDQAFSVPFDYPSADGRSLVHAKLWTSTTLGDSEALDVRKPKGIIQLIHGMAEHIDRYDDLANYFVDHGYVVCAEDHIGHGGTAPTPDDYGHMPMDGGKEILISDVHQLRLKVQDCFPGVPYIMYGHSMGSFILRAYLARHGEGLAAAVLSGTGTIPPALSKAGGALAHVISVFKGPRYRSPLMDSMSVGGYGSKIEDARTPLDWLSTDEAVVDAYAQDKRCGFMFTLGGNATLLDLTGEVVTPLCASRVPRDLPILFVAGEQDPVGDNGKGVLRAAQLLEDAGVSTVDVILYPHMRHEVHNEMGKEAVYRDILTWIDDHLPAD